MTRRCDRCGHPATDAIGTRQASLFDVTTDPLVTPDARAELRTGRILCVACRRTDDLFARTTPDAESLPGEDEADAAQIAGFYAEQEEQDRDADAHDARQIDAARARLAEQDRIAGIPRAVLDEQRAAAVRKAQGWKMLQTETDTATMERRVLRAFRTLRIRGTRPKIAAHFEHGQWWVTELATGGQWSACDASGPETSDGFSFECVTEPEEE